MLTINRDIFSRVASNSIYLCVGRNATFHFFKFVKIVQMPGAIKYVKDETGQKTSVVVPVKVWDDLNSNYKKLRKKLKAMSDIHQSLNEVHQARKSGKKLQTLKAFLSENSG